MRYSDLCYTTGIIILVVEDSMLKDATETRLEMSDDEFDALTGWRKILSYYPGELKKIKRGYQRRLRHAVKIRHDTEVRTEN
jgi:hypothetical protein